MKYYQIKTHHIIQMVWYSLISLAHIISTVIAVKLKEPIPDQVGVFSVFRHPSYCALLDKNYILYIILSTFVFLPLIVAIFPPKKKYVYRLLVYPIFFVSIVYAFLFLSEGLSQATYFFERLEAFQDFGAELFGLGLAVWTDIKPPKIFSDRNRDSGNTGDGRQGDGSVVSSLEKE